MYFPYSFWNSGISRGLLAFYTFNDCSNQGKDLTNVFNLTVHGSLSCVAAKISNGVRKNSTSGYMDVPDPNKVFNMNSDKTFCFWAKFDDISNVTYIVGKFNSASPFHYVIAKNINTISFVIYNSLGSQVATATSPVINQGQWYFVTCINNFTSKVLSIQLDNGTITTSSSYSAATIADPVANFRAPEQDLTIQDSTLDSLGVWNRILNTSEISFMYNNGIGKDGIY